MEKIEHEDLIQFGILPEFAGRFPIIVPFQNLNEEHLTRILVEPRNSLTAQAKKDFAIDDVRFDGAVIFLAKYPHRGKQQ